MCVCVCRCSEHCFAKQLLTFVERGRMRGVAANISDASLTVHGLLTKHVLTSPTAKVAPSSTLHESSLLCVI